MTLYSNLYAGKLLLRNEIPLTEETFQALLTSGKFTPLQSIKNNNNIYECQRCGNKKPSLFASLPCSNHHKHHTYCRKCIIMGRVLECEPLYYWTGEKLVWPKHDQPLSWIGKLTKEQQGAAEQIVELININKSAKLFIWAVAGSGKTEMLFPGINRALQLGKRICIATPRTDVVRELLPRLQEAFQTVPIEALYGGSDDRSGSAQLIIATTHQLLRYRKAFDFVIIDEIDAFPYYIDKSLSFATNRAKKEQGIIVYLSATPRTEFKKLIVRKKLPHVFVPIRFHRHPLPVPRLIISFNMKKSLTNYLPPNKFISWFKQRDRKDRQLLVFVPTIKLANKLAQSLTKILIEKKMIHSEQLVQAVHSEDEHREATIQKFRDKELFILITTTILERGVTFPSIDVVVFDAGHEVFDEAALVQIAGRAGRSPNDPTGEVIFFHDGKTNAMVSAIQLIKSMNKRGGF